MDRSWRWRAVAGMVAVVALSAGAPAQVRADSPPEKSGANPKDDTKARELLDKVRGAWKSVHTLSYTASSQGEAESGEQAADVVCQRAEAGGWKVAVHVAQGDDAALSDAGYDGVTARVVRPRDKTVVERSVDSLEDLRVFFTGQGLRHVVAWDVLEEEPFGDGVAFALGKADTIEGVACDVLEVTLKDDRQTTTPEDMEKGAKPRATPAPGVRVFVGRDDLLPRRIDRTRSSGGKTSTRTLVLRSVARDADASGAQFALEAPDGYRIRAGDAAKPAGGRGGPRPGAADQNEKPAIEGVTWPHDPKLIAAGEKAPSFRLEDAQGAWKRLSDYKGKVVVIDFWATWCGPCVAAIPSLQAVQEKYKDKQVVVMGLNAEGDPMPGKQAVDVVKFKEEKGGHYTTLLNADGVSERYKVRGLPTFYVLDAEGKVLWGGVGLEAPPENMSPSMNDRCKYLEQTIGAVIDAELKKMGEK